MSTLVEEINAQIKGLQSSAAHTNTGTVREVGDGIARVEGLSNVMLNEMVEFPGGVFGLALNLEENEVVDDKNQIGVTLGARRMQTPHKNLYVLKHMIMSHNGLLKQRTKYFIDNKGMPFIYEKTKFAQLKYLGTTNPTTGRGERCGMVV